MDLDTLLIAIIMAGIGLAGAYLKAEYALHMKSKAADRSKELGLQDLHAARVRLEQNGIQVQVRLTRAPTLPPFDRSTKFLAPHSPSAREHRVI